MNNTFLIEDHDEALRIWRDKKIKNLDLVHIDAHIDFGIQPAKPISQILDEARSLRDLKNNLEYSLAFRRFENDFSKQTNIGNFVYPAMIEGRVKDFYWVVPGGLNEFKKSAKFIKALLRGFLKLDSNKARLSLKVQDGLISTKIFNRKFVICTLKSLPVLKQNLLLDIDTDFLVIDNLEDADNTTKIGKRIPWILPEELARILKRKIIKPKLTTISYSVNGGYTPMQFKYLGDELAYYLSPEQFRMRFYKNRLAAQYFNRFCSTGSKGYYQKAIAINPTYRAADNNYGTLYLALGDLNRAKKEFSKILSVDRTNPACLVGLGNIALRKKYFNQAKRFFLASLKLDRNSSFIKQSKQCQLGLARVNIELGNLKLARNLLIKYKKSNPLDHQVYYLLGDICASQKDFRQAIQLYQDAIRLGFLNIDILSKILKLCFYLEENNDIIEFIDKQYKGLKKRLKPVNSMIANNKGKSNLVRIENKVKAFEIKYKNFLRR